MTPVPLSLDTCRSDLSPLFPLDEPQPSLYIPFVTRKMRSILSQVGRIERIDWISCSKSAFVHFSMWYDNPVSEELSMNLFNKEEDDNSTFRLFSKDTKDRYVLCRRNMNPIKPYLGSNTREYFIQAIDTMETAYKYGQSPKITPKHIRFHGNVPIVVEYWVTTPIPNNNTPNTYTKNIKKKNIHQLAAEYNWWISLHNVTKLVTPFYSK